MQHLIAAIFGIHMDGDMTVVGAGAKGWHRGPTYLEVKHHCCGITRYLLIVQVQ